MRQIKFRAWDKKNKKWLWPYPEAFHIIGEITVFNMLKDRSISEYNDIEIVEYTGLKDKNGVEIYEGDKVLFNDPDYWSGKTREAIIINNGYAFSLDCEKDYDYNPLSVGSEAFEVIGNIYEGKK